MADLSHNSIDLTLQTPGDAVLTALVGRLRSDCLTAADVRERAAYVRAYRARTWPLRRPAPPPPTKAAAPAPALPTEPLFIQLGDRRYQVASLKHASQMYCAARDAFGEGASSTPELAIVTADGRKVARISYNGRVWPAEEKPGEKPLYDPAAEPLPAVPGRITVGRVLEATAEHFGLTVAQILTPRRTQPLVRRRQVAMYVAHKLTGRSLPFIAERMGFRDHTTVLHGVRAVKALIVAGDGETIEAVNAIVARLQVTEALNV